MSNEEAGFLLEEMEFLLATNSPIGRRERALRIKDWISRQPMEGAARSERDRGDKRMMEYQTFRSSYQDTLDKAIEAKSSQGWKVHTMIAGNDGWIVLMERERAEGT